MTLKAIHQRVLYPILHLRILVEVHVLSALSSARCWVSAGLCSRDVTRL